MDYNYVQAATAMYRDMLGADVSGEQALPEHGVTTVFVNLSNTKLELLHPLGEKSPIAGFLEKNKAGGIHHICIEVRLVGVQDQSNNGGKRDVSNSYPFPKSEWRRVQSRCIYV